jgi:hypothetical protein
MDVMSAGGEKDCGVLSWFWPHLQALRLRPWKMEGAPSREEYLTPQFNENRPSGYFEPLSLWLQVDIYLGASLTLSPAISCQTCPDDTDTAYL